MGNNRETIINECMNIVKVLHAKLLDMISTAHDLSKEVGIGADNEPTTAIDKFAENFLIREITKKHKCTIMSEERGIINFGDERLAFIIDPVDGTSNAKRTLCPFSVSIGIYYDTKPIGGIVFDVCSRDMYHAITGQGAFLNGRKITCSKEVLLKKTITGCGRPITMKDLSVYSHINFSTSSNRIYGCPSLDICHVAAGKMDWASQIHDKPRGTVMDVAAAKIILQEAGGILLDEKGKEIEVVYDPKKKINFIACRNDEAFIRSITDLLKESE